MDPSLSWEVDFCRFLNGHGHGHGHGHGNGHGHGHGNGHGHGYGHGHEIYNVTLDPHEENTSGGIHYLWGGGRRKIHLVESTISSKGGGRLEKWPYLADKCCALRNNYQLGPFLTKMPRCLGFLVFHILCCNDSITVTPVGGKSLVHGRRKLCFLKCK